MADSQEEVRSAILARYRQLCAEHEKAQDNVEVVQTHQRGLMAQINDCFSAARLFGFDLMAEFKSEAHGDPRQSALRSPEPIAPALSPVPAGAIQRAGPSIKFLVLAATEKAYPHPVRAADIRKELANGGYAVHEKTVGMTLYRWSRDGYTRRSGRDWYFVPPDQRPPGLNGRRYRPEPSQAALITAS